MRGGESLGQYYASTGQAQQGKPACRSAKRSNGFPFKGGKTSLISKYLGE